MVARNYYSKICVWGYAVKILQAVTCLCVALSSGCSSIPVDSSGSSSSIASVRNGTQDRPVSRVTAVKTFAEANSEISSITSRLSNGSVLVIYDIDDTLLTTPVVNGSGERRFFGSDRWYIWQNYGLRDGSPQKIGGCLFEVIEENTKSAALVETENGVVKSFLQLKGDKLILTSRGHRTSEATYLQLKSAGFSEVPSLIPESLPVEFKLGSSDAVYDKGVFLTSGANKGDALLEFIKRTGRRYDYVFLVDDTLKNVLNVALSMSLNGTNYRGFVYGGVKSDPPYDVLPHQVASHERAWRVFLREHPERAARWTTTQCKPEA